MLKHSLETLQATAKERTVRTQSIEYDLETLVKKIKKGMIKLDPDYQRRHRWDVETSSRLIESLILNIPIPIIYLSYDVDVDDDTEDNEARYSVIDGQQRLTAILNFFENSFALSGLDILEPLDGCFYRDLPPFLLRRLEERTIKCLRIDSTVDPQVKYDIFERLNSGSVALGSHELRNAVLRGPFNNLCKKLAKDENFRVLNQISLSAPDTNAKVKKMEDVELVLRFFSLLDNNYTNYKKSKDKNFKDFLSDNLEVKNSLSDANLQSDAELFTITMALIRTNFGDQAFAKYREVAGKYVLQSKFNAAVYDALAIAIATEVVKKGKSKKLSATTANKFLKLFSDPKFFEAVSGSILDSGKIIYRIDAARAIF
jgi:uncharacterized protein with ParB-like and HNH nuclease domain